MQGSFAFVCCPADFFFKIIFFQKFFQEYRVSNRLEPGQDERSVHTICKGYLLVQDKSPLAWKELKIFIDPDKEIL